MGEVGYDRGKKMTVTRPILRNTTVFAIVCIAYFAYMRFVANALPETWGGEVNVIAIPFLLGAIGAISFAGNLFVRTALVVAATTLVLLVITNGGDPAKPGLHLWVTGAMVLIASIGALSAALGARLIARRQRPA